MTKIWAFFLSFISSISLFGLGSNIVIGVINDNSSIQNDLNVMGLTPSDYVTFPNVSENKYLDDVYVIGVAENRLTDNSLDVYFYFYNAVVNNLGNNYLVDISINNNDLLVACLENGKDSWEEYNKDFVPNEFLEITSYDRALNITKAKMTYENGFVERIYNVKRVTRLGDNLISNNPFKAVISERYSDGKLQTIFSFNSFIFITDDVLIPVNVHELSDFKGVFGDLVNTILGKNPWKMSTLFFYNFSSSKRIEEILEVDVEYDSKRIIDQYSQTFGKVYLSSHTTTDEMHNSYTIYPNEVSEVKILGENKKFNPFKTPANARLNDFGDKVIFNEEDVKKFTDYEHSIFVQMDYFVDSRNRLGEGLHNRVELTNFKVSRLEFKCNGEIFNSYVADEKNDSITPINPTTPKTWWEDMIEFIKANPLYAALIVVVIVILIPVIVVALPSIIMGIVRLLFIIIEGIFKLIALPFKAIKSLFKRKKEDKVF